MLREGTEGREDGGDGGKRHKIKTKERSERRRTKKTPRQNTDAHRRGSGGSRPPGDSGVQEGRLAVSDLRPGGARPVDEGNAADQNGTGPRAALICSIPLIHRGMPRQVASGALSVLFRVCLWPSDSVDLVHNSGVTKSEAAGPGAGFLRSSPSLRSFVLIRSRPVLSVNSLIRLLLFPRKRR